MKVAVLLHGHMRSYLECASQLIENLIKPYNADVFISTWSTITHNDNHAVTLDEIQRIYENARIEVDDFHEYTKLFIKQTEDVVAWQQTLPGLYSGYRPADFYSAYYKKWAVNAMKTAVEQETGHSYDVVVSTRPDILIPKIDLSDIASKTVLVNRTHTRWVDDILTISNSKVIDEIAEIYPGYHAKFAYAKAHDEPELFMEVHTCLYKHLTERNINIISRDYKARIRRYP